VAGDVAARRPVRSRRALARGHRLLEVERARSEELLHNVLPASIAERLKRREEGASR
jgi:hypothetical protein